MTDAELMLVDGDVRTLTADSRGRVNLGTDYADSRVRVAVLEVLDA